MAKFKFISVSKDESQCFKTEDFTSLGHDIIFVNNNKDPLPVVYNRYLEEERSLDNKHDFVVFIHADVKFDIEHLCTHCDSVKDSYDVIGLCGCSKIDTSRSPLGWFTASSPFPESRWGCVIHGELKNQCSFFSSDRKNIKDAKVGAIDGLCMIIGRKALDSDISFDERFTFDFYDMDFSFTTILKYKMRLGVIVEDSLQHYSVGRSILSEDYLKHEYDFRMKWGLNIPKKVQEIHDRT